MAQEMIGGPCRVCNCHRMFVRNVDHPNHAVHFLLGLLTCSAWWWIWLLIALMGPRKSQPICTHCGSSWGYDPERVQAFQQSSAAADEMIAVKREERRIKREALAKARLERRSEYWKAMQVRCERFNQWINTLEPEQRIAMIAAPGFIVIVLSGLGIFLWSMYG